MNSYLVISNKGQISDRRSNHNTVSNRQTNAGAKSLNVYKIIIFFLAHSLLAILIRNYDLLAMIFPPIVILIGIFLAVSAKNSNLLANITAYICGCEVLWRMTDGSFFYEIGKYATILILAITFFKEKKRNYSYSLLLYFILLLPGVFVTYQNNDFGFANDYTSFYLSGPCAILMYGCFYTGISINNDELLRIFINFLAPVIGIATLTVYGIFTASDISFTTASNFQTSGGFGPNQVSAILGMGALLSYFIILINRKVKFLSCLSGGLIISLGFLSAITLSRGGTYLFIIASLSCTIFLFLAKKLKSNIFILLLLLVLSGVFLFPSIDSFANGYLTTRFAETTTTHRAEFIETEIELWQENPLLGLGIGEARHYRDDDAAAHTEFSRVVAEHGTLGFIAILLLLGIGIVNIFSSQGQFSQALKVSFVAWFIVFMTINALRLVAPAFIFGLSFAKLYLIEDKTLKNN